MRCVALGKEDEIGIKCATVGADADDPAAVADQAFCGSCRKDGDAVPQGNLGEMMIVDGPKHGVTMAERRRISVGHAEQAVAIGGEEAAFDQPPFPSERLDAV